MCKLRQLTDEELVERIRGGDSTCMDILIERYKRQVRNQARALYLMGGDNDDLIQEGMLGLFKAIRDYRPEKEASFEAFAGLCISRQLYSAVQAAGRQEQAPESTYGELPKQLETPGDGPTGRSAGAVLIDRENIEGLRKEIWKVLSPMEKKILQFYLEGESYTEIAAGLNRSPKSVDNALQRIRRKLKKFLAN